MSLLVAYLMLSMGPLIQALLLTLQTWENRRFIRSCFENQPLPGQKGRVAVIAPCKGIDVNFRNNLARVLEQDQPNYEVVFVVDSVDDPAYPVLESLIAEHPHTLARIVVSGPAKLCSQKIHNLRYAIKQLDESVQFFAFVDSDALPRHDWLRRLVRRLGRNGASASTSYRWFVPQRNTFPNLLLASLDHSLAPLVGPRMHHLVWGGSWAIRRDVYESIGLDDAWSAALSDDLVASRMLASVRAWVQFEPLAMAASPLDVTWGEMFEFVRRQFAVVRWHEPRWWMTGLLLSVMNQAFFWASAVGGLILLACGLPLAQPLLAVSALIYVTHVYRALLRQSAAKIFVPDHAERLAAARRFDLALHPLASILNVAGLLGSAWGRDIRWRGVQYTQRRDGAVARAQRDSLPIRSFQTQRQAAPARSRRAA